MSHYMSDIKKKTKQPIIIMALIKKLKMRDCNIMLNSTVAVGRSTAQRFSVTSAVAVREKSFMYFVCFFVKFS